MEVRLDELRLRYERFSDEALIDAWTGGPEAYTPQAWAVITSEVASRGLATPGVSDSLTSSLDGTPIDALRPLVDESRKRMKGRATRQMGIGVLVGSCGVLVTVFSYFSAESTGGHYYVVAWGAVLFGVVQFVRGLTLDQQVRRGHDLQSNGLSE